MPLPGRDKTFAFESCRDVLDKLDREIDRYRKVNGKDIEAMKDLAFNISVTAWHLCDWVYGDLTAAQRHTLKIEKLTDLQKIALENRELYLCRQAAIASKH